MKSWIGAGVCPLLNKGDEVSYKHAVIKDIGENVDKEDGAGKARQSFVVKGWGGSSQKDEPIGVHEIIKTSAAVEFKYNHNTSGCCPAFKCLALAHLGNGDCVNPGNTLTVDCEHCPVLAENPKSYEDSPDHDSIKASSGLFNSPELDEWLIDKIANISLFDKGESLDCRNKKAGLRNGYHAVKHWNTELDYEDLVDKIKAYITFRQSEGSFGQGIKESCENALEQVIHLGIKAAGWFVDLPTYIP